MASRRKWLQQIGMAAAAIGLAPLEVIASPKTTSAFLPPIPDDGTVRLSSNENPYGPSPMARTAMAAAVGISNRYQWQMIHDLKSAIAAKYGFTEGNVLVGAGSTQIIDTVIQYAALQKGNCIVAAPTFDRWTSAAEKCGLQKIAVPLTPDKRHDLPAMLRAIKSDTRMVYICNPNNPSGTVCNRSGLLGFIEKATPHTLVVVDEAYIDYSTETSLSNLVATNENLVVIKTFSKIYGLAGARIGYALAHEKTIDKIGALQSGTDIGIGAVSLAGAMASLKDENFVRQTFSENEKARAYTMAQLQRMNILCIPSHTNFIYFSLAGYPKDFFAQLKAANIEGTGIFEEHGKWSRITVGTQQDMEKFIGAIG